LQPFPAQLASGKKLQGICLPAGGMPVVTSKKRAPVPTMPVASDNNVQVEHLSSLVTAHFKDMSEHVWLGDPEEVGKRHWQFLKIWFAATQGALNIEVERKAFSKAFPKVKDWGPITSKLRAIRKMLVKKHKNMKTGSNTPFWVKELCGVLCSSLPAGSGNSQKEEDSLADMPSGLPGGGKKPSVAVAPVEEMVLSQMSVGSSTVTEGVLNLSVQKSHESIDSASSAAPSPSTKKRPAAASLPAAGHVKKKPSVAGDSLPAAGHVKKKPSVAASAAGQEVATELKGWLVSASFGEVKATRASQKSYIQARATASDKPYCLVNIEGKAGVDHRKIVDELVVFAQGAGLNKAQVIAEREALKENVD